MTSTITPSPTKSRFESEKVEVVNQEMLFGKKNYLIVIGGLLVMVLGFALMAGGHMPSSDVWEPERIYSFRRIVLAPIVILAGLGLQIYAIFSKK